MVKVLSHLSGGEESYFPYPQTGVERTFTTWITDHNNECAIQYESDLPYHQIGGENYFHKYFNFLFLNRDKSKITSSK